MALKGLLFPNYIIQTEPIHNSFGITICYGNGKTEKYYSTEELMVYRSNSIACLYTKLKRKFILTPKVDNVEPQFDGPRGIFHISIINNETIKS